MERLNNTCDKIMFVIQPCNEWKKSYIPLTRHRGKSVTRQHIYMESMESLDSMKKDAGIAHVQHIVYVVAIDPVWERKAYGSNGLWRDVLRVLQPS